MTNDEYEDITPHLEHELLYVEEGTDWRSVDVDENGGITIGKSKTWECTMSDIRCVTCDRVLHLDSAEWVFS